MDVDPDLIREWNERARRLEGLLERFPQRRVTDHLPPPATQAQAHAGNVTVEMKDVKVPWLTWICVCSAVLCAVLSIITLLGGGMLYLNMKDHLDAIYMMAPQLNKPTGDKAP